MRLTNILGLKVEKASFAGASFVGVRFEVAIIRSVSVTDLLAYWRSGHGANDA
jgi:hypothetical protein